MRRRRPNGRTAPATPPESLLQLICGRLSAARQRGDAGVPFFVGLISHLPRAGRRVLAKSGTSSGWAPGRLFDGRFFQSRDRDRAPAIRRRIDLPCRRHRRSLRCRRWRDPEIAFAGRSNVGKSSLINALTGRKALARTSNTPGRTQELIFFGGPDRLILVDMPGYGYAATAKKKIAAWTSLIHDYLRGRATLGPRLRAGRCAARPQRHR